MGDKGSLTDSYKQDEAAKQMAIGFKKYYESIGSGYYCTTKGVGGEKMDTVGEGFDMIGSAGSVMASIKDRNGDMQKFTLKISNKSPHVIVPFNFEIVDGVHMYAKSSPNIMRPGESTEIEFDMSPEYYWKSDNFKFHFSICGKNGNSVDGCFSFQAAESGTNIYPHSLYVPCYGDKKNYAINDDTTEDNILYIMGAEGKESYPSFGVAMVKVPLSKYNSTCGIEFTPWSADLESHEGEFDVGCSESATLLYDTGGCGSEKAAQLLWNCINRTSSNTQQQMMKQASEQQAQMLGGVMGMVASGISCGVNLINGSRNLSKQNKNTTDHNFTLHIGNYTKHIMVIPHITGQVNCFMTSAVFPPDSETTIQFGIKELNSDDDGANVSIYFLAEDFMKILVKFNDTTGGDVSRQIRVGQISFDTENNDGLTVKDDDGLELTNKELKVPFYRSAKSDGVKPEFIVTSTPVSNSNCDVYLTFIN